MSILSDKEIKKLALECGMIEPFFGSLQSSENGVGVLSYGLSSYGYDVRVGNEFKIFGNVVQGKNLVVDPKNFSEEVCINFVGEKCIIPPNGFALGLTLEKFKIPRDCIVICLGKSTYARCGVIVNVTPIEPEWEGYVVLEFSNTTQLPVAIYANEGACQFVFLRGNETCEVSYKDRKGKYMHQDKIVLPKV